MNRQWTTFGAVLCLVAIVSFAAWPLWEWLTLKTAPPAVQQRVETLVGAHPELKPAWNIAMHDGVLTWDEAKEIVEGAGEKLDEAP